ncbi:hypothetical protein NCS56_00973500 [Fusarium sp. Ph1]|nr:hypothetical protein NCS56_00973500 [Fusarium sp. Ph1]
MVASVHGTPGDPPTETSKLANPTSITPGISDFAALKDAIQQVNIEAVRALAEKGADVNSWLPGEGTVLQIALGVAEPRIECVRMLLDNGANIYKGDTFGNALTRAVDDGLDDVLDLMVQGGYVRNEAELPPDQRLENDMTILHVAVCCRNRRALKRLLESPAKEMIDHQDTWRRTPLHYATQTYSEALHWVQVSVDVNAKWYPTPGSTECEIAQVLWKLHQNSMPTKSEFETFRDDLTLHDFIACRFITTYPSLFRKGGGDQSLSSDTKLDGTSIELVRRSHVLLWTMVKSGERHIGWDGIKLSKYIMLKTTALITTSQHAELAIDVCKLLNPLLQTLREKWMLEEIANEQRRDLSELNALFVNSYQWKPHERKIPPDELDDIEELKNFGAAVSGFCEYLAAGVKNLTNTSQELIGLESLMKAPDQGSSEVYVNKREHEASQLDHVKKPVEGALTKMQSLFGMNVNVLESNPPWWIYIPFAFATLGLTMVVWLTFKRYPSIEDKAERVFRKLTR